MAAHKVRMELEYSADQCHSCYRGAHTASLKCPNAGAGFAVSRRYNAATPTRCGNTILQRRKTPPEKRAVIHRVLLFVLSRPGEFVVSDLNEADETAHSDMKIKCSNAHVCHTVAKDVTHIFSQTFISYIVTSFETYFTSKQG